MLSIIPLDGLPEIRPGDCLDQMLADRLAVGEPGVQPGDVLVVTQKIVSKAENRFVDPSTLTPSARAIDLAGQVRKDPALVELVLRESREVVRTAPNVLITRHRLGHVMANAGIDASNIGAGNDAKLLLLPEDPDRSARKIADCLSERFGFPVGVIVSDSFGRPWRMGTVNVAIGVAGIAPVIDQRGEPDRNGREMQVTQIALADAVSAAAGLAMGEAAEGLPCAIVRGLSIPENAKTGVSLLRPDGEDLFR